MHAASLAKGFQRLANVGGAGVAHFIGGGANVQAELATTRHDVDRAVGHFQHADGRHQMRHAGTALLDEQRQLGGGGGRVAAAIHRRGAGMAGHADDLAHVAHAAVD